MRSRGSLMVAESSKRGTTFQRSKIHKKAAETRRKTKKAGKRDQTWKSSTRGIVLSSQADERGQRRK